MNYTFLHVLLSYKYYLYNNAPILDVHVDLYKLKEYSFK